MGTTPPAPQTAEEALADRLAWALLGLMLIVVLSIFQDFGISWDEEWQHTYGGLLLDYYASLFSDRAVFAYSNLYLYGGLFDMTAALLAKVSPFGVYETRHLLGGLTGLLAMAGTWRLARLVAGPRAGLIAFVMLATAPLFFGHMFFNPKDVPFAAGMVWSLFFLCRLGEEAPAIRAKSLILFGVTAGLTIGTRAGGLMIFFYAALTLLAFLYQSGRMVPGRGLALAPSLFAKALLCLPFAYVAMGIAWPWAVQSPLNPLLAMQAFSNFGWAGMVEIDGEWVSALNLPRSYLLTFLTIQLPLPVLAGLAACGLGAAVRFRWIAGASPVRFAQLTALVLAAGFPILFFIIQRPNAYHTIRHFLFLLPPLIVLAAIGIDRALTWLLRAQRYSAAALVLAFIISTGNQIRDMVELHPNQYVWYNELVGGVPGAQGRYELDYWGSSLAEAARALAREVGPDRPASGPDKWKVLVCGYPLSASYFLPDHFKVTDKPAEADFFVSYAESDCNNWLEGKTIVRVERQDVLLSVAKDRREFTRPGPAQTDLP